MNKNQRQQIFERLAKAIPDPQTELIFASPFELLVAVVLSAQATDKSVNKATEALFKKAATPEALLSLGEEGLKGYIGSIGLFNSKAKHLIGLSKALIEQHDSKVPSSREALEALPGVGRKTANVILNTAFGQPTIAVDTHIFRLANRIRLAPGQTVLDVEKGLLKTTPKAFLKDAHHLLILHGRYVCTARQPKCGSCVIQDLCEFKKKSPFN
jgi:endonuclease-3